MRTKIYEDYEHLLNSWEGHLQIVNESVEGYTKNEALGLALVLENTKDKLDECRQRVNEGVITDMGAVNALEQNIFELVTATMPSLIANDIVSVQPLDRQSGTIYYFDFEYGDTKGGIKAGETMFSGRAGFVTNDYAGEKVTNEIVAASGETVVDYTLPYSPVKPGTVVITDGVAKVTDKGDGSFEGDLLAGTPTKNSIDYATGKVEITINAAAADVYANWEYDLYDPAAKVVQVTPKLKTLPIFARPRKLKSVMMLEAVLEAKNGLGVDLTESVLKVSSAELQAEIDNDIMQDLLNGATESVTWNMNPAYKGMDEKPHWETITKAVNACSAIIYETTQRFEGSFMVCGTDIATIIESLGRDHFRAFPRNNAGDLSGPKKIGVLDEKYLIIKNPKYPKKAGLVGAKSQYSLIAAGFVYAPYIPIFTSQLITDENFQVKQGYASLSGKRMINAELYVRLDAIENTPAANN